MHESSGVEKFVLETKTKNDKCFFILMYRPPPVHIGVLVNSIVKVLDQCFIQSQCIYLLGDLNVEFNETPNVLTNLLKSCSLVSVVKGL